jgi:hypothetical protein
MLRASTGGMAFGPPGTPHCFQTIGDATGAAAGGHHAVGLERFFEQFAELLPRPVDPEGLAAVGLANWIEFVGPPVGVSDPIQPCA